MDKYGLDLEIGGLYYNPFWKTSLFYGILIVVLASLMILAWYKLWFRSKKRLTCDPIKTLVQSLQEQQNMPINVGSQVFYLDLILKFKEFIRYKYQLDLKYKTDDEVKAILIKTNSESEILDPQLVTTFIEILNATYVARFAKQAVNKERMGSDLDKAVTLMRQIIYKPYKKL